MYSRSRYSFAWLSVLLAVPFGCVGDGDMSLSSLVREEGGGGGGGDDEDEYVGHQGRLLLGFRAPDVRTFVMSSSLIGLRVREKGELISDSHQGRDFIGQPILATADGVNILMRIADVREPTEDPAKWQYALEQYVPGLSTWIPACADPPLLFPPRTPPSEPPLAIALPGTWTPDGLYFPFSGRISFACSTGAVAKCDSWGYGEDIDPPDKTESGTLIDIRGADMLQACTRMARADFCAQGIPNTFDGTPIRLDDIFQDPPPSADFVFEAAWPGVAATDRLPQRPPVVCLSKLRWSTMPLGGTCPLQVPDPRVDGKGKFCDDIPLKTMETMGARTYSLSSYLDAGLYTYTDPSGAKRLTTGKLVPGPAGQPPTWLIPQPPTVEFPMTGQSQQFEATIFAPVLPSGISETNLVMLRSYRCPDDYVTTTAVDPKGCAKLADEGQLYPPGTPGRTPLRRWWHPSFKRSHTTAIAPTTMIANGWRFPELLGGAIRAGIDVNLRWSAVSGATYSIAVMTRAGEWVQPCIDTQYIGSATSFVYRGKCNSASFRPIDHADIAIFRVTATSTAGTQVANRGYNGADSDLHVDIPVGKPTAVAVSWTDVGQGYTYALDVRKVNGDWIPCFSSDLLGNGLSHVHTGSCPSVGAVVKLIDMAALRVCATWNGDPGSTVCGETDYTGGSLARVELVPSM